MYATPVVYPLSALSGNAFYWVCLNPASAPIELFRYSLWGEGTVTVGMLVWSWAITAVLAITGIMLFNHVERVFADTV